LPSRGDPHTLHTSQTLRSFGDTTRWDERDKLALQQQVPTLVSSQPPADSAAAPAEAKIVLPAENKTAQYAISASLRGFYDDEKQLEDGVAVLKTNPLGAETAFSDVGRGGLGGGAVAGGIQERIPVLGDEPTVGKLYRAEPQNDNSALFLKREGGSNDRDKSDASRAQETQQAADSFYNGGTFYRYSTIQPQPVEGQRAERVREPGMGDAPVLGRLPQSEANTKNAPTTTSSNQNASTKAKAGASDVVSLAINGEITPAKGAFEMADPAQSAPKDTISQSFREAEETTAGQGIRTVEPTMEAKIEEKTKIGVGQKPAEVLVEMEQLKGEARKSVAKSEGPSPDQQTGDSKKETSERLARRQVDVRKQATLQDMDLTPPKPAAPAPIPQPEVQTRNNALSTFSLNVSDVSFKLAAASLEKGVLPEAASIRSEEFINAFDYRDAAPAAGQPVAFAWERARYPFAQNRDALRFSIKTAASGRQAAQPLNIVLLLDNSGSMERADRVSIIQEALRVLASQLQAQDTLSVVTFARTPRLWVDGVPGNQAGQVAAELSSLTPQGGTNLEEAMNLAYQTALRHYAANGINHVVLLTDGAANLGDTDAEVLKTKVETNRKQGIALDCFGIGWEGYNDDLLEVLTHNGDGRYGFLNTPEEAASEFAGPLAGALHVAASDVKVQVEFNPNRVSSYRQVGYARHQLTKEQFRDNTVDAAELGAAESGNALYVIEVNPQGNGPLATVRVRYKVPGTAEYREQEWTAPFTGNAASLEQTGPAIRLATTAGAFSEWLASSPYATEVAPDRLLGYLNGIPQAYGADPRPQKLEWMIRQAKAISGR